LDFHKSLKILGRRKWTVISVAAVTLILVLLAPTNTTDVAATYKSQAKILLTPSSGSVKAYGGTVSAGADLSQSWFADETILNELLLSEELLTRVADQSEKQITWIDLKSGIEIQPISKDRGGLKMFALQVTDTDPKEAQKLTRLVADEFVNYVQDLSAQEYANTRRFIEELVLEAEQRRLSAEEALMGVREKYLGLPTDEEIATRQSDLESQRQELQRDIGSLQAELASIKTYDGGQSGRAPWAVLKESTGAVGGLEQNVADQKIELAKLQEVYTEDSAVVKAAKARLATAERLYQSALDEYVASLYTDKSSRLQQAISRTQSLSSQLNDLLKSRMTQEDRREVQKLERQRTLWEENHLSLLQQLYQARVVEQSSRRQGSVNILEQPRLGAPVLADDSVSAPRAKQLGLAIPFCLIMGIGAAFLREYLTSSMRLRPRVEEALELPVIAVIPSTPSELTVDWERFKRPMPAALDRMIDGVRDFATLKAASESRQQDAAELPRE
jgi:capsular polysaccharide biosynthesis protein